MVDDPKVLSDLKQDHERFARIIRVLEHELQQIKKGESEDWKLLADSFEYIEAYPDLVHHPREDALYRYCSENHPAQAAPLLGLEEEHQRICQATSRLSQELKGVFADNMLNREALIERLEHYLKIQSSHMAREEGHVFPFLLECLTDNDWDALYQGLEFPDDPLFDDTSLLAYDALYERIMTLGVCRT